MSLPPPPAEYVCTDILTADYKNSNCNPSLVYNYSTDNTKIVSVTVSANGNSCGVPVPVTVPATATSSGSSTYDKVGTDPAIYWTTLMGSSVTLTLSSDVNL